MSEKKILGQKHCPICGEVMLMATRIYLHEPFCTEECKKAHFSLPQNELEPKKFQVGGKNTSNWGVHHGASNTFAFYGPNVVCFRLRKDARTWIDNQLPQTSFGWKLNWKTIPE